MIGSTEKMSSNVLKKIVIKRKSIDSDKDNHAKKFKQTQLDFFISSKNNSKEDLDDSLVNDQSKKTKKEYIKVKSKLKWKYVPHIQLSFDNKGYVDEQVFNNDQDDYQIGMSLPKIQNGNRCLTFNESLDLISSLSIFSIIKLNNQQVKRQLQTLLDWEYFIQNYNINQKNNWKLLLSFYNYLVNELCTGHKTFNKQNSLKYSLYKEDFDELMEKSVFVSKFDFNPLYCITYTKKITYDEDDNQTQEGLEEDDEVQFNISLPLLKHFTQELFGIRKQTPLSINTTECDIETLLEYQNKNNNEYTNYHLNQLTNNNFDELSIETNIFLIKELLNFTLISEESNKLREYLDKYNNELKIYRSEKRDCIYTRKPLTKLEKNDKNDLMIKKLNEQEISLDNNISLVEQKLALPFSIKLIGVDSLGRKWKWIYVDTKLDSNNLTGDIDGLIIEDFDLNNYNQDNYNKFSINYYYPSSYNHFKELIKSLSTSSVDRKILDYVKDMYTNNGVLSFSLNNNKLLNNEEILSFNNSLKPFSDWMNSRGNSLMKVNESDNEEIEEQEKDIEIINSSYTKNMIDRLYKNIIKTVELYKNIIDSSITFSVRLIPRKTDYINLNIFSFIENDDEVDEYHNKCRTFIESKIIIPLEKIMNKKDNIDNINEYDSFKKESKEIFLNINNEIIINMIKSLFIIMIPLWFKRCKVADLKNIDFNLNIYNLLDSVLSDTNKNEKIWIDYKNEVLPRFLTNMSHTIRSIDNLNLILLSIKKIIPGAHH